MTERTVDHYVQAATRDNTRRSYQAAVRHFEVEWGGFLPATADGIARYLATYAPFHAFNTLKQRLAALGQWHVDQGFPDPTKAPLVRKTLKGIGEVHSVPEKQAKPLQLAQLHQLVAWLDGRIEIAVAAGDRAAQLRYTRDKAFVLIGFWRAFRSDELCRLTVENIDVIPNVGMTLYLGRSKTMSGGKTYRAPALARLCPVAAYQAWVTLANLTKGPVFRKIDRWGRIGEIGLNPGSVVALLRTLFEGAGLESAGQFSSHSMRRGFASWAAANGWGTKELMDYVGWRDVKSAMRYIEGQDPFAQLRIGSALSITR